MGLCYLRAFSAYPVSHSAQYMFHLNSFGLLDLSYQVPFLFLFLPWSFGICYLFQNLQCLQNNNNNTNFLLCGPIKFSKHFHIYFLSLRMVSNPRPVLTVSIILEFKSLVTHLSEPGVQLPDDIYSSILSPSYVERYCQCLPEKKNLINSCSHLKGSSGETEARWVGSPSHLTSLSHTSIPCAVQSLRYF